MRTSHLAVASLVLSFGVLQGTAKANYTESFESGNLGAWSASSMNGSTGSVNTSLASDGIYGYSNSFTVPAGWAGWGVHDIISIGDMRTIMNTGATSLSLDAYSNWTNPNGWGVYGNAVQLLFNSSAGWSPVNPTSGSLVNGAFSTLTWDLTALAPVHANPSNGYAQLAVVWFLGTWADNGQDNGTQTLAIDNIRIEQPVIPEPASLSLIGLAGLMMFRRRH